MNYIVKADRRLMLHTACIDRCSCCCAHEGGNKVKFEINEVYYR